MFGLHLAELSHRQHLSDHTVDGPQLVLVQLPERTGHLATQSSFRSSNTQHVESCLVSGIDDHHEDLERHAPPCLQESHVSRQLGPTAPVAAEHQEDQDREGCKEACDQDWAGYHGHPSCALLVHDAARGSTPP